MENNFKYSFNEKRYHTFNYYLKEKYHAKVSKVILDANFSCPNRDGNKAYGGCIFCSLKGSGDSNTSINNDLLLQYENNKRIMDNKWHNNLYIPYFQSFSNTYGPLDKIKKMLEPFLNMKEVCEISIATRCDCLDEDVLEYLNKCCHKKPIWLEIGLQTTNDEKGKILNRQYNFLDVKKTLNRLEKTNIKVCLHIINGLPYENEEDMLKTIKDINHLRFDAIKIHMLCILKNTKLETMYNENPFPILSREEYIKIVVKQLELLKPEVIIERLTGDSLIEDLVAPSWTIKKVTILNDIDKLMRELNTYQGVKYR